MAIIRERYWDFGPTLAAEKLREVHGIAIGRETLRQWMIEDGLWLDRKQRRKRVHQPRHRRECVGELVQIDGCEHWWFEDRGPQCTLLVFVDDATSRLMHLQFVESESTFAYFHAARAYLEAWGKPSRLLQRQAWGLPGQPAGRAGRRRHDPVRPRAACAQHRHHLRQFEPGQGPGRARPQDLAGPAGQGAAAGRASQLWRRATPCSRHSSADYNTRFAKPPANGKDLHRPLRAGDDLEDAFAWKEERTLSRALTLQYDKVIFILEPSDQAKAAIGKRVTVVDHPDGRLLIRYNGVELAYRTFDKMRQVAQGAIIENKRLGAALAFIREQQLRRGAERRSGPRRRDQRDARLFKVG